MFNRLGDGAFRFRKILPLVILAAIVGLHLMFGVTLADKMSQEGWDDPGSSSTQAAKIELDTFGRDNSGDVIVLFSDTTNPGGIEQSPHFAEIQGFLTALKAQYPDQIDSVTSFFDKRNPKLKSADGTTAFAAIALKGDSEQTLKDFRTIQPSLLEAKLLHSDIDVEIAGATAVADALDAGMAGDIKRAELYALPAVGLLLLFVFGSVVAAAMPLIVGGLSILGSLSMLAILAGFTQVNVFAQSVVTLLGLGLAIDYGLFMVSRFREELDRISATVVDDRASAPTPALSSEDIRNAVRITTATAGKTVVFSAAMVAVALSGLLIFPQAFLKSVAYGAISAVGLAALLSVTLLPALFALLGTKIDFLTIRRSSRRARSIESTWWYRIPAFAMKRAGLVTIALVAGLLALTLPLAGVKFGGINETYLPPSHEVRSAQTTFNEQFPEFRTEPIKLVVTGATNDQLVDIFQQANHITGLSSRFAPSSPTSDGTTVLSAGISDRSLHEEVVDQLRTINAPEGVNLYIGGTPALEVESIEALFAKLPWMALYIVLATFLLMALVFGSLILPAKAIIMTILGMGATLGILTAMFVDGIGAELFHFTPGPLMSPVLVLIMAIVYGLSTDYEVFLVSRMVEARDHGASTDEAIKAGTAHTGGIITAAALIMIVVCGAFGFSDIIMMKYIAFGMIFALIFDATIIRMLLVPAVMHLLREDNWWAPNFIKRASALLGHNSAPTDVHFVPSTPRRDDADTESAPVNGVDTQLGSIRDKDASTVTMALFPSIDNRTHSLADEKQPQRAENVSPVTLVVPAPAPATKMDSSNAMTPNVADATAKEIPVDDETPIHEANIIDPRAAGRSGRLAAEDNELVPFAELLKRLKDEG
ncbi:MAG: MMPL family transporter [Corynebacterium sp.]|uniref:MMPL family transporter n=1 Tax=Corynebacterium sp. TaxID=1720 RepID=UPI0026DB47FC|nr:MMPL family transporter [Corynebacterium sp.]MDO4761173.1 MMPL family transporter [Corynebacterium sp.]